MKERVTLSNGFGYCEIRKTAVHKKDGSLMVDKNGNALLLVSLFVVDSEGQTSYIDDFINAGYLDRLRNFENSFYVKGIWTGRERGFNQEIIKNKCAGCLIDTKHDEKYGVQNKIRCYVPLAFYKLVVEGDVVKDKPSVPLNAPATENFDDIPF
jgi:hypothetical protein